jgi:hypothetical protein
MVDLGDTLPWFGRHSRVSPPSNEHRRFADAKHLRAGVILAGIQGFPEWMPVKYTLASRGQARA